MSIQKSIQQRISDGLKSVKGTNNLYGSIGTMASEGASIVVGKNAGKAASKASALIKTGKAKGTSSMSYNIKTKGKPYPTGKKKPY